MRRDRSWQRVILSFGLVVASLTAPAAAAANQEPTATSDLAAFEPSYRTFGTSLGSRDGDRTGPDPGPVVSRPRTPRYRCPVGFYHRQVVYDDLLSIL